MTWFGSVCARSSEANPATHNQNRSRLSCPFKSFVPGKSCFLSQHTCLRYCDVHPSSNCLSFDEVKVGLSSSAGLYGPRAAVRAQNSMWLSVKGLHTSAYQPKYILLLCDIPSVSQYANRDRLLNSAEVIPITIYVSGHTQNKYVSCIWPVSDHRTQMSVRVHCDICRAQPRAWIALRKDIQFQAWDSLLSNRGSEEFQMQKRCA